MTLLTIWLRLVAGLTLVVASVAAPAEGRDPYFGLHIHRSDEGTPWPKPAFGSWRLWDASVSWANLEPRRGQWNFAKLDRYVAFGERFGVDILYPFGLTPAWASARPSEKSNYGPGLAAEPASMDDWRTYVRTVAERYRGRVRNYDIWNEINVREFYSGSIEKMVELTCEAQKVLRAVSPENRVVSPSFIGAGSEPDQLENFLRKGGKDCIDIVGFHFYVPHREPEEIVPLVRRIQAVMVRQGIAKMPLWNTESGWWMENGDDAPQKGADKRWRKVSLVEGPAVVSRTLLLGRWAGLERFYWYAWDNAILGLVDSTTGNPKPAAFAYETLVRWMAKATPQCAESGGRWVCSVPATGGETRRVVWKSVSQDRSFDLPSGERVLAIERLDGTRESEATKARSSVVLGPEPVLVVSVSR